MRFSNVVAAWNADMKDDGSNLLSVLLFLLYSISNLKDVGSNPENSKSKQFCLHIVEEKPHPSYLLQLSHKNQSFILFKKI